MGSVHQLPAFILFQLRGYKKDGRRSAETGRIELIFVDHELFVKDGQGDSAPAGLADVIRTASEILDVGKDTDCSSSVPFIAQRLLLSSLSKAIFA